MTVLKLFYNNNRFLIFVILLNFIKLNNLLIDIVTHLFVIIHLICINKILNVL